MEGSDDPRTLSKDIHNVSHVTPERRKPRVSRVSMTHIAFNVILLAMFFEFEPCQSYEVASDPGTFVSPSVRSGRAALARAEPPPIATLPPPPSTSSTTKPLGSKMYRGTALIFPRASHPLNQEAVIEVSPSSSEDNSSSPGEVGQEVTTEGPDGHAVQRTFLVLAGLGVIIISYLGIKFACIKTRRRRDGDEESRYGLVETSEMDLLDDDDNDEEEEEDDTLFDLHSHRRT